MPQTGMSLPHPRYLHPEFLPIAPFYEMPHLRDGMGWKILCRREGDHYIGKLSEGQEEKYEYKASSGFRDKR